MKKMSAKTEAIEADQDQRNRMSVELDANIAVRAAAGSGKTRSTVDRIVAMALDPAYLDFLPHLVVVTFTNAAADELRTRARKRLIEEHHDELKHLAGEIIPKFGQIFFGTIHSFCMRILREFGHLIDLPAKLENLEDQVDEIHDRFRREREEQVWDSLDCGEALRVFRFGLSFDDLVKIGRDLSVLPVDCAEVLERSCLRTFDIRSEADRIHLDPGALDGCKIKSNNEKNVRSYQKKYRNFCHIWNGTDKRELSVPMIGPAPKGGEEIKTQSAQLLAGVHDWFAKGVLKIGLRFAAEFQAFRWKKGCLTFNDQILLAARLTAEPGVLKTLRGRNLRVILDEAQDTTPLQFKILTELTRPFEAVFGTWPSERGAHAPRPGHFVMVGDAQQSIFESLGADISCYLRHGDALESAMFQVTFRCNRAVVEFVNSRFPAILDGKEGQARFVELMPKRGAEEGRTGRLVLDSKFVHTGRGKPSGSTLFREEAELLSRRLKQLGPAGLGAERWSDVAVLMPRNKWLSVLAGCLEEEKIPCRMTARRKNQDDACWRWVAALLGTLARGDDGYQLAGVLREVFGMRDGDMAEWVFSGGKINLSSEPPESGQARGGQTRMAETILILRGLKRRMEDLPALMAVDEMIRTIGLSGRLEALKNIPGLKGVSTRMLSLLRGRAAEAEARGVSWKELAEDLIEEGEKNMPEILPSESRDGIVLMTCQKAKGQEWPVVILPGLSRPMWPAGKQGKHIEVLMGQDSIACRVKGVSTGDWDETCAGCDAKRDQEMRRVYYVACTRAKKHLILVDTRALWKAAANYKYLRPIQALSASGESEAWMDDIPGWKALPPVETAKSSSSRVAVAFADWKSITRVSAPKIVHPSEKDEDREKLSLEDLEERSQRDRRVEPLHGALIYGNWWHDAMFHADWSSKDVGVDLKSRVEELPAGDLRKRGRQQIEVFLCSRLFGDLSRPGVAFHRELVYTRSPAPDTIEDGKIDLIYQSGNVWNIIDWKTDVISDRVAAKARASERYAGQLTAYVEALKDFDIPIGDAGLYFTAIGETLSA